MSGKKSRFLLLKIITFLMLCAIIARLFILQIMDGESYRQVADNRITTNIAQKAPRGQIYDRYGVSLVSNEVGYSVIMQRSGMNNAELNEVFERITSLLKENNCEYYDTFPLTTPPYRYDFKDENGENGTSDESSEWFSQNIYHKKLDSDMSAISLVDFFKEIYEIDSHYTEEQARRIIGARYEAELHEFSSVTPFTISDDVNAEVVTRIKESKDFYKGITVSNSYVRKFDKPGIATHIIGRTGRISAEEYAQMKNNGYGMNDMIGKQGVELWAEKYLRGIDGVTGVSRIGGTDEVLDSIEPVPGNYLVLTIDSELQQYTEQSLERTIKSISANGSAKKGADCDAGAAVCIDVKTGDILACASYPTYDMSSFNKSYASLIQDDAKPMWNRAVSGTYSPGSTFKPLTAIAALQTGVVGVNEIINDEGVYRYYADYQPACWIWNDYKLTHGRMNVSTALENSCNYFFYEAGRRMGINKLSEYAGKFGLGEYTGIELKEEASGHMASPEYKKQVVSSVTERDWYGGDTLQAAIGQSYSLFTPVQLANYTATIANGGTRYKVNLIKSIRSSVDGSIVKEFVPQAEEKIDMSSRVLNAVKDGMKKVTDEGSASDIFSGYSIPVGGKTGTAQLGNGSNNALFVAYAPFDDPQIAVAVVLEHGVSGANAAYVARDIFDKYFSNDTSTSNFSPEAVNPSQNYGAILP